MYETEVLRVCKRFLFLFLVVFYAKLRTALIQRSRPTKKRKLACACSACHKLHTASYDLTNRSIANRATPINITMETPLMTRRDNWSFMLEFCRFTVLTLGVFYFLWQERNPKKVQLWRFFSKAWDNKKLHQMGILNGCDSQRIWLSTDVKLQWKVDMR